MTQPIILVGIDMGTHATRVVVSSLTESGNPQIIGIGIASTRGIRNGYVINIEQASKSLRSALIDAQKNTGMRITEGILSIGGISLRSDHIATTVEITHHAGEVTESDIQRALDTCEDILLSKQNNIRVIHRIPLKYKLDGHMCLGKPIGLTGKKLSVKAIFITALEHHVEDLIAVAHAAGVSIIDIAASPLAASTPVLSYNDRKAGAALLDIGSETCSLVVFEDNQPVSLEVFSIGSTDITNDLALGFQISLEEADTLKKGNIQPSKARKYTKSRVDEIISARISDIAELVERHLVSVKKNHLLPAGVVITGGGSHLELLPQIMKHTLRLPIRVAADGIAHQGKQKTLDASWYVAYGLCVWIIQENSIRLRKASAFVDVMKQLGKKLKGSLRHLLP